MGAKDYIRARKGKKYTYKHDDIWRLHYGEIPEGMVVHHVDGNKKNNDISNLKLLSIREHNRLHAGFIKIGDVWFKKCKDCCEMKEVNGDNWYINKKDNSVATGSCKKCFREKMRLYQVRKRENVI